MYDDLWIILLNDDDDAADKPAISTRWPPPDIMQASIVDDSLLHGSAGWHSSNPAVRFWAADTVVGCVVEFFAREILEIDRIR